MRMIIAMITALTLAGGLATGEERQLTFSPVGHHLDNNDNFSQDDRFLSYDTRETLGPGLNDCISIGKVEIATGKETVLYKAKTYVLGERPAPGMGAASFSPIADEVCFILGPAVEEIDVRGPYGKPNRNGACVPGDGSGKARWLDKRDVATDRDTIPGAHRGGTHRHEYSPDGKRIGFTYDDFFLSEYARTIGYMIEHPKAPAPASHYFALLVRPAPTGTAKPGEIELASGDSWVGREGKMRAFIGKVKEEDGTYQESLFVVDIPDSVDITTADAGSPARYPSPPKGLTIRRLTHSWAGGVVRGAEEGDRIAYYAKAPDGSTQVFVIPSGGSDKDPAKGPVQLTNLPGTPSAVRWHPSSNSILCISNNAIVSTCCIPGDPRFGKSVFLTPQGDDAGKDNITGQRGDLVISRDGSLLAFGKAVPTKKEAGETVKNYKGEDLTQIFVLAFPDKDGDGVADE